jgi:DNA repair protein RadC
MVNYKQNIKIKSWAMADRPREKLMLRGRRLLTDAELIAILIRAGSDEETAVALGQRLLSTYDNDLQVLGSQPVSDLMKFKGMGEAKAIAIIAALELGRRRKESPIQESLRIVSSKDVYELMLPVFADLNHEEFWIMLLNRGNKVIGKYQISRGGQAGTVADPKIIFRKAMDHHAAFIILCHNHPSGNLRPSPEDIDITKRLIEAGKMMDLLVIDHLIITNKSFYSLCDEGVI